MSLLHPPRFNRSGILLLFSKYGSHVPNALYQSKAGFCSSANLCLSHVFHLFISVASGSLGFSGWWWLRWQLWALSWDSAISTPSKIVVEHPTVTITPNNAGKFFLLSKRMDTEYQSVGVQKIAQSSARIQDKSKVGSPSFLTPLQLFLLALFSVMLVTSLKVQEDETTMRGFLGFLGNSSWAFKPFWQQFNLDGVLSNLRTW